ncbi:LacI family DNA-binding transcriptional regulator [Coraliomargarita algicola]|uniref:LacI family DNA-binding transcriptional regulator n=1 Tax=Coraliomargarita algicola TaxID=3092156 RepID=A0ABZ0RIQ6_9BACT|nr:LacI family DNA-binding transcriptional regulator [Coraliomargarita sp. J2-16]WPJ95358.1 LacI family DNA-binding transcriptional regulator [Coraliomargarita sp. J2-16]
MKKKKISSMAELAKIAKCSVMTVSYALRGSHEVSEETRLRIQKLAHEYGYRKNPFVSALITNRRSKRSGGLDVIGLITKFDVPMSQWKERQHFYSDLYEGMVERAAELGFRIDEFPTYGGENALNGRQLNRVLATRGIRGVILMPGGEYNRNFPLDDFDYSDFSVVAAAFHARQMHIHRTATDYSGGIELCLQEASKRGYKRIGLAMDQSLDPSLRYGFSGRFLAWQAGQLKKNCVPLIAGRAGGLYRDSFLAWYQKHKPDCILSPSVSPLRWLEGIDVVVPRDVGCIFVPVRDHPHLSGFDARTHVVGRTTVNLLARELFLNNTGLPEYPEVVMVSGQWQEGNTVALPVA